MRAKHTLIAVLSVVCISSAISPVSAGNVFTDFLNSEKAREQREEKAQRSKEDRDAMCEHYHDLKAQDSSCLDAREKALLTYYQAIFFFGC